MAELIVMTRYFPLLETRTFLRTMIFGAGVLAAGTCVRGRDGGRRHTDCGGDSMTRLLLVAAALVVVLAAAGVGRVGLCRCSRKEGSNSV